MKPAAPASSPPPASTTPQCPVLLQLVSEEVLPNLLAIMALRPGRLIQVRNGDAAKNPEMEAASAKFRHALQVLAQEPAFKNYQPKIQDLHLPHLSPDISSTRDLVANTLATTHGVTVNFSGGTRLMSIGAFQAAAALGRPSLFCDTKGGRFSDGRTGGGQARWPEYQSVTSQLSARLLMAVEGRNPDDYRSEPATDPLRAFGLRAFELANQHWNALEAMNKALRSHFHTHNDRLPNNPDELRDLTVKPLPPQAAASEPARQFLAAAVSAGLLKGDAQNFKLNTQATKRAIDRALSLLLGGWLELAVMDCLLRNPRFKDAAWSFEPAKNDNSDYSDTNLLCVDQQTGSLRLISCKATTTRPPQELLDSVKDRSVRLGGPGAAATLVLYKPVPSQENAIRSYARRLGVDVALEADEIVKMFSPHAAAKRP